MNLTEKQKSLIKFIAHEKLPLECCGLIIETKDDQMVVSCGNVAANPSHDFELDTKDYLHAAKMGKPIAVFHSHPITPEGYDKDRSLLDEINCNGHNLPQIIYRFRFDDFIVFQPENKKNSYLGHEFSWGKSDCLTLAVEYYNNELKLNLADSISRERGNFWKNDNYFKFIREIGFKILDKKSLLKIHDCLITKYHEERPPHLMIYIGANKILHQPINDISKVEELNETLTENIVGIARHKSML